MTLPDREKVIKGLLCCAHTDGINCVYCPYDNTDEDCTALMSMDVLNLLKEQEPKTVQSITTVGQRTYGCCPSCGRGLDSYQDRNNGEHITRFCYNCGQAVKWDV